jgi:hypothetical protein
VKKSWVAMLMLAFASLSAMAQDGGTAAVASPGKMLVGANGARLGAVYRVTSDGSPQLIVNGKMVTVPASTLSMVDGELKTSLSKSEVSKLR